MLSTEAIQGLFGCHPRGHRLLCRIQSFRLSGWSVMLAVPKSTIAIPLRQSLWIVAGGASFFPHRVSVRAVFARRITVPIEKLSSAAQALGKETVPATDLRT
jgi:hypothetical protein